MGFWVGIKRALNSTLGTKKFKPLDQIISEEKDLVASDNLYQYFFAGTRENVPVNEDLFVFKSNRNGSIRIVGSAQLPANVSNPFFRIYQGDNILCDFRIETNTETQILADLQITKGSEYKIVAYWGFDAASWKYNLMLSDLRICAHELNISGIEII